MDGTPYGTQLGREEVVAVMPLDFSSSLYILGIYKFNY